MEALSEVGSVEVRRLLVYQPPPGEGEDLVDGPPPAVGPAREVDRAVDALRVVHQTLDALVADGNGGPCGGNDSVSDKAVRVSPGERVEAVHPDRQRKNAGVLVFLRKSEPSYSWWVLKWFPYAAGADDDDARRVPQ